MSAQRRIPDGPSRGAEGQLMTLSRRKHFSQTNEDN
jgi:hypothetical protein